MSGSKEINVALQRSSNGKLATEVVRMERAPGEQNRESPGAVHGSKRTSSETIPSRWPKGKV